ncbi:MAG: AAA family ATPase [Succinivibrionaceae bacterium]|jgi:hypothetical protein|nr:AAA family ATPase [Succinivibrionaceae bacterium]MDY3145536.1 AAA family ATPase [Succinivibrionaceae bacterium]MDY6275062.1 AAA family ATPase [Succinivibrionaceae bacterium]MDY6336017.1 AAA family ATPase [Succinivibrionaceae bacterium]
MAAAAGKKLRPRSGGESFESFIRGGYYYVDKTQYIRTIFEYDSDRLLMLRPRRFGKTLMMSTLRSFFEMNYENPGDTSAQRELFKGLDVMKDEEFCSEHMGQYPVVSLSLKETDALNFRNACDMLGQIIWRLACRFAWLKDSRVLIDEEKEAFSQLLDRRLICSGTEDAISIIQSSLVTLCSLLLRHCGRKPVLLIDEYDVPLQKAAMNGYYQPMSKVVGAMLGGALKSNDDIFIGILTGCLRATKEGIFTGLNNYSVNSVLSDDDDLSAAFGFTPDEVQSMFSYYGISDLYGQAKSFYDGYRIGSKEIFCPWDVTRYASDLLKPRVNGPASFDPPAYWNNTSNVQIITQYMPNLNHTEAVRLQNLLEGQSIEVRINEKMNYGDFNLSDASQFWNLLVYTGYLTLDQRGAGGIHRFRIPNAEIRECFDSNITAYYSMKGGKYFENYSKAITEAIFDGNTEGLTTALARALSTFVSARDVTGREPKENYYHGMLNGILVSAGDLIGEHSSNTDSGDGYADITVCSADFKVAAVIELKYASSRSELDSKAKEALRQIAEKDYAEKVRNRGIGKIFGYGIAFFHRQCSVAVEQLPA